MKKVSVIIGFALLRSPFFFFLAMYAIFSPAFLALCDFCKVLHLVRLDWLSFCRSPSCIIPQSKNCEKKENEISGKWGANFKGDPGLKRVIREMVETKKTGYSGG